jgi:hypothetical protein
MTSRAIERVEKVIASLEVLQSEATSPVERVDLSDIRSDLDSALEKLQALQTYQESPETDYECLWETRKKELKEFEKARNAWIRTEIFSMVLQNAADQIQQPTTTTT